MLNVPNAISGFRLLLVPVLLLLARQGTGGIFLACLTGSLLMDFLDGFLARRLHQQSELGARLDSWADFMTYLAIPLCAWWLWPGVVRSEALCLAVALVSYLGAIAVGFCKFRRLTSYHSWAGRLSTWLMGGAFSCS